MDLYYKWGEDFLSPITRVAREALRDVMAEFDALEVFYSRTVVEASLRTQLTEALGPWHFQVENFQLLEINLPGKFQSQLRETENLTFKIDTANFAKEEEVQLA